MVTATLVPDKPALYRSFLHNMDGLLDIGDITVEDFAVVWAQFSELVDAGWYFPPEFKALMMVLHIQCQHTDDDSDSDLAVDDGEEADEAEQAEIMEARQEDLEPEPFEDDEDVADLYADPNPEWMAEEGRHDFAEPIHADDDYREMGVLE